MAETKSWSGILLFGPELSTYSAVYSVFREFRQFIGRFKGAREGTPPAWGIVLWGPVFLPSSSVTHINPCNDVPGTLPLNVSRVLAGN